jgi:hypothetical protein
MNYAKIHLSTDELLLVKNAEWILTKNVIIGKVGSLFGALAEQLQEKVIKDRLPNQIGFNSAKISKGENYNGLPYVMLDCPRLFTRQNIFSIRTFFWWGNYFSVTLHLKGEFQQRFTDSIRKNIDLLAENEFFLSVTGDQWEHDLRSSNYLLIRKMSESELNNRFAQPEFLKIGAKLDFSMWDHSEEELLKLYALIIQSLGD